MSGCAWSIPFVNITDLIWIISEGLEEKESEIY